MRRFTKTRKPTEPKQRNRSVKTASLFVALVTALALTLAACSQSVTPNADIETTAVVDQLPQPGTLQSPVENLADYNGEPYGCGAELEPGPKRFEEYLDGLGFNAYTYHWKCRKSFHEVGRAVDIKIDGDPLAGPEKQALADWLTANNNEMAKRLGIVQIVWNKQMWRSYSRANDPVGGWGSYNVSVPGSPTSEHTDHIHLSFGPAGTRGETSFFTEVIGGETPPTPPTPTGWPTLSRGSSNHSAVMTLQYLLKASGATQIAVDGDFGPQTESIVRYVQGAGATGVVDGAFWASLVSEFTLRQGSQGTAVKALQQRMTDKGYTLTVDGDYGPVTRSKVLAFQRDAGITVDGWVGSETWRALMN